MGDGAGVVGVEVRLLGGFAVESAGRPVDVGGGRVRALFAVLALAAGEPLTTAQLAERIWGDDPPANIGPSLHTLMTRLRRGIGAELITTATDGYRLRIDPDQVDVARFERLLRTPRGSADEYPNLVAALKLWRGRPFEGVRSDWLESVEAPRLAELHLTAVERRADLVSEATEYSDVLAELRRLVKAHPLRESLWVRLLRVLAKAGRSAEALELYEEVRRRLAEELGADPGAELQGIFNDLLTGPGPARPAPVAVPHQLPADIPGFAGRQEALEQLDAMLELDRPAGTAPIVAIDGTGGSGKTVLSVHWAHRVRARFPDGQLFLNLRGYSAGGCLSTEAALELLLLGLGVRADDLPVTAEARTALFRTLMKDRQVLLVLDNARDTAQVRPLLPGAGGFVLVTSRNQLRGLVAREGARRLSLGPMSPEESAELLARAVPDRPHDLGQLKDFAELCGRLPLALVIGAERAGRTASSDIQVVIDELAATGDRLDALEVGGDELSSVRAVLSWSYQALPPASARVFRLLGAYPGAVFSPPVVGAIARLPESEAGQLLDSLVEVNLLEQVAAGAYQFHDILRLYAAELAGAEEAEESLRRALDWLTRTAEQARLTPNRVARFDLLGEPLPGVEPLHFADGEAALAWFGQEWNTLISAVRAGAEAGLHRQAACLASQLWDYLEMRRSPNAAEIAAHELAVRSAELAGDQLLAAVVLNQLAIVYGLTGRLEPARDLFHQALDKFVAIDNHYGTNLVHSNLGFTYHKLGDFRASLRHQREAVATSATGHALGSALNNLAFLLIELGDYAEAIVSARRAVEVLRADGYQRGLVHALDTLGHAYHRAGDLVLSAEHLEQAVALGRDIQVGAAEILALRKLGDVYLELGRRDRAREVWERALAEDSRLGTPDPEYRDRIRERLRTLDQLVGHTGS